MNFAIICDARKGQALGVSHLALVDRGKSKSLWWTSDDTTLIMKFYNDIYAESVCEKLTSHKHTDCPRVVSHSEAVQIIEAQANEIMRNEAETDASLGWDEHKGSM